MVVGRSSVAMVKGLLGQSEVKWLGSDVIRPLVARLLFGVLFCFCLLGFSAAGRVKLSIGAPEEQRPPYNCRLQTS